MANYPSVGTVQAELTRQGASWAAADNPISRLSEPERVLRLGVNPGIGDPTIYQVEQAPAAAAVAGAAAGAPSAFDLRNINGKNYVTAIRDQANCGSCVAFGSLATIEGSIAWNQKTENPQLDLSEAHLFYCYGKPEDVTCATGWMPSRALVHCATGIVDEACFPYHAGDQQCSLCADWQKRMTKIRSSTDLTGNVAGMKNWISTYGAVAGCFIVYDDFFHYRSGVYRHITGDRAGGHCISIVGYDDTQSCWICKNSWNTTWGEQGFFRIAYGECGMETWQVLGVSV